MLTCPNCGTENPREARFCLACGSPLTAAAPEVRKVVTIVRCDVTGSTALGERLDPETLRRVMSRYFEEMRVAIERHGGTVEKFIGDAVMAVFGIPVVHEDDALRAVRAATEMREALSGLNEELMRERGVRLEVRTGVTTGEVIAGDSSGGQAFVTGDAANVAARLESSAQPREILIDDFTYRLVSAAVDVDPLEPLTVKGKTEPLVVWRLLAVRLGAEPFLRRLGSPLVGRYTELARLQQTFRQAKERRACELLTVVGEAGIGKSRLTEELVRAVGDDASVLRGRCLPYGEAITYWPLVEMFRDATQQDVRAWIIDLLRDEPGAEVIAERLAAAVGAGDAAASSDEIFWATRKVFERLAREHPLVVVIDDLHWAEPTFLDLVEHIAFLSHGAPIVLLCLARPELLAKRPEWPADRLHLPPLQEREAESLLDKLAPGGDDPELRARILASARGNPLFLEQMLAMLDQDPAKLEVPPTIRALLVARLDRLDHEDRRALECASVVGEQFWSGAVRELLGGGVEVGRALLELVRRDFVAPDESRLPGEDAFRFVHGLVRDAAYDAIPKVLRAQSHERCAEWLARKDDERGLQHDEIVGYHLEQAFRYREQLGPAGEPERKLAAQGAERLARAGTRAFARQDDAAAASLLARAAELLPADHPARLELLPDLGAALQMIGELTSAEALLADGLERVRAARNPRLQARMRVRRADARQAMATIDLRETLAEGEGAVAVLERFDDPTALAEAWLLIGKLRFWLGTSRSAAEALERAAAYARRSGNNRREELLAIKWMAVTLVSLPAPADDAIRRGKELLEAVAGEPRAEAGVLAPLAWVYGYAGRYEEAREAIARSRAVLRELGVKLEWASVSMNAGSIELLAGDPVAAERELREGYESLEQMGEKGYLATVGCYLAEALYAQGRYAEAEHFTRVSEEAFPEEAEWRSTRAKILARRGEFELAERLAREAEEITSQRDSGRERGEALAAKGEVLWLAGQSEEAAAVIRGALALYDAAGARALSRQARALLEKVSTGPVARR